MEQRNDDMLKTACDIADMRKTSERISGILSAENFDMQSARDVIYEVNIKHPENVGLYNLFTFGPAPNRPHGSGVSIDSASAGKPVRAYAEVLSHHASMQVVADILHISKSGLSLAVMELEQELGVLCQR